MISILDASLSFRFELYHERVFGIAVAVIVPPEQSGYCIQADILRARNLSNSRDPF